MLFGEFATKPVPVLAARYDGRIETGDKLIVWVRQARSPKSQRLFFENETRLVMHGSDGTEDIFEGWWLVKYPDNSFEVVPDDEFPSKFTRKGL